MVNFYCIFDANVGKHFMPFHHWEPLRVWYHCSSCCVIDKCCHSVISLHGWLAQSVQSSRKRPLHWHARRVPELNRWDQWFSHCDFSSVPFNCALYYTQLQHDREWYKELSVWMSRWGTEELEWSLCTQKVCVKPKHRPTLWTWGTDGEKTHHCTLKMALETWILQLWISMLIYKITTWW